MNTVDITLPSILVVDDLPENLVLIERMLKDQYKVQIANNGEKAIELATANPPDLILLDVMMPAINGYETCRRLKENDLTRSIPIIFLTSKNTSEDEETGLLFGAVDFVRKPVSAGVLHARIRTHLGNKVWLDYVKKKNRKLEQCDLENKRNINRLEGVTIDVMALLSGFRRESDCGHHLRIQQYVRLLITKLAEVSEDPSLNEENVEVMVKAVLLHDVGKIAVPETILLKQNGLSEMELCQLKAHTLCGYDMLMNARTLTGGENSFLSCAADAALSHHENWDGTGYPQGLKGQEIPLIGRLIAVAEAYDTHREGNVESASMSYEEVVRFIEEKSGLYFDPDIVNVFLLLSDQFEQLLNESNEPDASGKDPFPFAPVKNNVETENKSITYSA